MTYDNAQAAGSASEELRIKMYAMYDHFPDKHPEEGKPFINFYSDTYVEECTRKGKNVAFLLEPRSMIKGAYRYVSDHWELFEAIFTHDSDLLKYCPNALYLNWAEVWLTTDSIKEPKISLVTSPKNWCPLHNARLELYRIFMDSDKVDTYYGDWNNPAIPTIEARDYLEKYMMSIVIENDIDDYWYTEKILNCFATKTLPIYVGATKIGTVFNADGIIHVEDWREIPNIVNNINIEEEYLKRLEAIQDNYERVKPYRVKWKDRFFAQYGELLADIQKG